MEFITINLLSSLLLLYVFYVHEEQKKMLYVRVKKLGMLVLLTLIFSSVLCVAQSFAADTGTTTTSGSGTLFGDLTQKGIQIFTGMRDIIYVVSGFGIIGVAIGGFFGNINWKWLGAIVIGLMVIGLTGEILIYVGGGDAPKIEDTLK